MSARQKLNVATLNGILLLAGIVAALCQSWTVFWALVGLFTVMAIGTGGIRLSGRSRGGRRRR